MGDPAGIGGEILVGAWQAMRDFFGPGFVALDDPERLARLGAPVEVVEAPAEAAAVFARACPVLPVRLAAPARPGQPDPANAPAIIASIERATALAMRGEVGAVVTNPINKAALYAAGFRHPGHTEFLAELTGVPGQEVMMLACPVLRVVPVTIHVSLRDAIAALTAKKSLPSAAPRRRRCGGISASRPRASPSPASTRTPAKVGRSAARTRRSSHRRSRRCAWKTSTRAGRGRRIRCSRRMRAPDTTPHFACITTRR